MYIHVYLQQPIRAAQSASESWASVFPLPIPSISFAWKTLLGLNLCHLCQIWWWLHQILFWWLYVRFYPKECFMCKKRMLVMDSKSWKKNLVWHVTCYLNFNPFWAGTRLGVSGGGGHWDNIMSNVGWRPNTRNSLARWRDILSTHWHLAFSENF